MRVNIYAEEMTDRVEIIEKVIDGQIFTGLRVYLELPATVGGKQYQGPFMHREGDDDSSAVTFWGKAGLRTVLRKATGLLDEHYAERDKRRAEGQQEHTEILEALGQGTPGDGQEHGEIIRALREC